MELKKAREEIDNIDRELIELIARRLSIAKDIAKIKKDQDIPIQNKEREEEVIQKAVENMKDKGYDEKEFMKELYNLIMKKSRELQK